MTIKWAVSTTVILGNKVMRSVSIKMVTVVLVILLSSSITGHTQVLFSTDITSKESSVSVSPNGLLAVYTAKFNPYGIVVRRLSDWSVHSRIEQFDELGYMSNLNCRGFVNDTILVAGTAGPNYLICNINTGTVVDTIHDLFFETLMSADEIVVTKTAAEVKECYAYNIHSQTTRFLFQTFKYDKVVSSPSSPYIVVDRSPEEKPIIYRKSDIRLVGQINCSIKLRNEHPFSVTEDGMFVYCLADPFSIGKYSLENGALVSKTKLPQAANGYVDVYVNHDESLIAYLVENDDINNQQDLFIIDNNGYIVQKVIEESGSIFCYFEWQKKQSSNFYLGTTAFLRERSATNSTYSKLLAVCGNNPTVYTTCGGKVAIVDGDGNAPVQIDITNQAARIMYDAPPYEWLPQLLASKPLGTDSVLLVGLASTYLTNPCTIPWYNDPTSRVDEDTDMVTTRCYSSDGQWVVGTTISDSAILVRNRLNGHKLRISNVDQGYYSSGISIAEAAGIAFVAGSSSVLKVNMMDGQNELYTYFEGLDRRIYPQYISDSKVDIYGRNFVCLLSPSDPILCRSFPDDAIEIEPADTSRYNSIVAVDLSKDGSLMSLIEKSGLVRILDTKTLKETHRLYLNGFTPRGLSVRRATYVNYDIESRILISINLFGELIVQRWPEEPVSVTNWQDIAQKQTPAASSKMFFPSGNNVTISAPINDPIVSVACYNVLGMEQFGVIDITTSGNQVELVNQGSVVGPVFVVVDTKKSLYTYSVIF